MIVPAETELTAPYWEGARRGELRLQHCRDCGRCWHPPSPICPDCRSRNCEWRASAGLGTLHSFTVAEHAAHPAFEGRTPYAIALVALDEGPLVVANLRECAPAELRIGLRVRAIFEEIAPGVVLPQFAPAAEPPAPALSAPRAAATARGPRGSGAARPRSSRPRR